MSYQTWLSSYRSRSGVADRTAVDASCFREPTPSDAPCTRRVDGSGDGTESLVRHQRDLPVERPGKEGQ